MFDAHCHLRDERILPYHERYVQDALAAGVTACIDCACRPEEWAMEVECALEVTTAYGLHPWYAGVACPDWAEYLEGCLKRDPKALVGEIGLDGIRKVADNGIAQRAALQTQLELAARYNRPVVLHGARAWAPLIKEIEPWAGRIPAWMFHGASFNPKMLEQSAFLKRDDVWFGVGCGLLTRGAQNLPNLVAALPLERVVVETDSPDMFPRGGEPLVLGQWHALFNQPGNLPLVLVALAQLRNVPIFELMEQTEANTRAFISARL